jgi:hypothetical protein
MWADGFVLQRDLALMHGTLGQRNMMDADIVYG